MKVAVVLPTYNEAKNISRVLEEIFSLDNSFYVLVVDDNSPDGTSQTVQRLQSKYHNLGLITRKGKLGLASAYQQGFNYILKSDYSIIIQMDADLSHPSSCIPAMIDLLDRHDLVIGSRYVRGGGSLRWPLNRVVISWLGNIFAKTLLKFSIHDSTSGFKCMKRKVLEDTDFNSIPSKGFAFQIEMVFRAFLKGFKIAEYPIVFQKRDKGKPKMSVFIIFEAFYRVMVLWFKKISGKCLFP